MRTLRTFVVRLGLATLAAAAGGCALPAGPVGEGPAAVVLRGQDVGFDDNVRMTRGEPGDSSEPVEAEVGPKLAQATPAGPGFPDEVLLGPAPGARPFWQRGRETVVEGGEDARGGEDTDLGRSRAGRRGEGGGPTRSDEEREEVEGEEFKSDLLVRLLGLEDTPYNVFGWLQGSFTGNPSHPPNGQNFGVFPNFSANHWLFQEFFISFEKRLDPENRDGFDLGFRLDNLFGSDWSLYHMVGLFDGLNHVDDFGWEPVQFYGEVHLPWFTPGGVDVKAGRFFSLGGYEDFLAPGRPLNSGSYMFGYAQPFTHLGVVTTWHAADRLNLFNGAVNGWDRWFDRSYRWGYAGGLVYDSVDGRTNVTGTLYVGPIQFPYFFRAGYPTVPNGVTSPPYLAGRRNPTYSRDNAVFATGTLIHEWTDELTVVVESDAGFEPNIPGDGPGGLPATGQWYGLAGWMLYAFNERWTGVYRGESFRDVHGTRTGFNDTYFEMTLGLILKPRSWFWVRPEVRGDWASGAPPYDDGRKRSQLTIGFDTIFLF